ELGVSFNSAKHTAGRACSFGNGKGNVLGRRQLRKQAIDLECARDPVLYALAWSHVRDVSSERADLATCRWNHTRNQIHKGGFAGPIWPNQSMAGSRFQRKIHSVCNA